MTYPSNVVPYNVVRYGTPQVGYNTDETIVAYRLPRGLEYLLDGAISTLLEVNNWRPSANGLTQQEAVDAFNNEVRRVDICELVAECIRDSTDVQQAVQQVAGSGYGPTTVINNTQYSQQVLVAGDGDGNGCGPDARFGRIKSLVSYINTVMLDFFQSIDAAANIITQVSEIVAGVPLIETLPFDEVINAIGNTAEFWRDSYEASLNTQLIEDFECRLYCASTPNCDITIADVRAIIEQRYDIASGQGALASLTGAALIARIATTITAGGGGAYIGDDFVYLSWLLQLAALEATGTFFGVEPVDYATQTASAAPNSGWSACDCDPPDPQTYTAFFDGSGLSNFVIIFGNYNAAEDDLDGVVVSQPSGAARGRFDLPAGAQVTEVRFAWRAVIDGNARSQRVWLGPPFGSAPVYEFETPTGFNGRRDVTIPIANVPASEVSFSADFPNSGGSLSQIEGASVTFVVP